MLDRPLDAFVADLHFERLTLNGFARISQGATAYGRPRVRAQG
jgi:hypothetical protein